MAAVDQLLLLFQEVNQRLKMYEGILAIVGMFYVGKTSLVILRNILRGFRVFILAKLFTHDFKKYGKWAVVTGATDGIGKAYARELARRGMSIILISRSMEKLEAVAKEIEMEFKAETFVVQADFSKGREIYPHISKQLEGKDIGVLINNVGTMYEHPSLFLQVPEQKHWDLINLNCVATVMMTYIILPQMVQRKKGVVINLSSISTFYPLPLMAGYSASKVFVDWFSRALDFEYSSKGIVIQSLVPSYISTKLVKFSSVLQHSNFIVPDPNSFVKSALSTVGFATRTTGYWSHGLQYWLYEHIPQWLWQTSSWFMQKAIDCHKED